MKKPVLFLCLPLVMYGVFKWGGTTRHVNREKPTVVISETGACTYFFGAIEAGKPEYPCTRWMRHENALEIEVSKLRWEKQHRSVPVFHNPDRSK